MPRKAKKAPRQPTLAKDAIPRTALAREVQRRIETFGLSQTLTASIVDDAASQISRLMTGHIAEFSADRLVKMLLRLGSDVEITIKHSKRLGRRGRVKVKAQHARA